MDLRTLQGEQIKSFEELMIANWLFEKTTLPFAIHLGHAEEGDPCGGMWTMVPAYFGSAREPQEDGIIVLLKPASFGAPIQDGMRAPIVQR
ncbi:hypothetical protein ROLI_008930 [Roseobacter fucihabitans]|uniref:Uncharacterized protein n=1 Tax=Roseobacter fucihabitans TaxID=1537242 RepID=A0ABZ2BP89_9RHOB|nr:hypothetical protein [Roseobacter litoralis]